MSSTRLPGKVLRPLAGGPMIGRQIERLRRAARIDRLVVATSDDASDDVLAGVVSDLGVPVHRGPLEDVLSRFAGAMQAFGPADHVVRLTADCPFTEPEVIDAVIARLLETGADYVSNTWPERTFPKGLDAEAMRADVLMQAYAEAEDPYEREHVTAFIYRRPERFRIDGVSQGRLEGDVVWTVDTPGDYAFAAAVYQELYGQDPDFGATAMRELIGAHHELSALGGAARI
jgi:spore coat polysaccharide biosynthesis protein SpsF